jgi:serine/threonine protein kinase
LSDIAALVTKLSELGINGPRHFDQRNISSFGRLLGSGSQFDVYEDSAWNVHEVQRVYKRVKPFALDAKGSDISTSLRARLRTVYLEIASLCHPLRRSNRNIVNLIEWGYDYPTSDLDLRLPLVVMERARAPLDTFLSGQKRSKDSQLARLHHHLSLDISSGLECVHESGLIHGDMKPSNILIFENDQSPVKYTAKLSDFGQCIFLGEDGGGSEAFDLYRGSPCWQPPEIITRDSISAPRASSVLLKADSFAFALVVLSTFLRNGRPLAEEPAGDLGAVRVQCSVDIGHLETSLSMQKMLLSLMETALITEGQSRPDVHPALLACDATSYHEW